MFSLIILIPKTYQKLIQQFIHTGFVCNMKPWRNIRNETVEVAVLGKLHWIIPFN